MVTVDASSPGARAFRNRLIQPALVRAYFLAKMPLAALAGLKIHHLDGARCDVSVPHGWATKNPFGTIYFAALAMAAELSCAALALMAARGASEPVSVFPIGISGKFEKRALSQTTFTCTEGELLFAAVNEALRTGEAATRTVSSTGRMSDGTVAATFELTWSFKKK
jgi:uncharacterized protein DUF4442